MKRYTPFKIALALFLLFCTLPLFGVGLHVLRGQTMFEHWYVTIAELLGGAAVATFVVSAHNRDRDAKTTTPPQDVIG